MAQTPAIMYSTGATIDYTPAAAVIAGQVVLIGTVPMIAEVDIAANGKGSLTRTGVWKMPKTTDVFVAGDAVYWNPTADPVTGTAGSGAADSSAATGHLLGFASAAAATGDTYVFTDVGVGLTPEGSGAGALYTTAAASAAVTNTVTETAFDKSVSIAANTLMPGDVIRVRAQIIATATNATDTLDMQLRLGTTDILATGAVDVANGDIGFIDADIVVRTIGAGGTMVAVGHTALGVPGTVTSKPKLLASTTLDTTAAISVNVSATWSVANAGNSVRLDILNVQLIR